MPARRSRSDPGPGGLTRALLEQGATVLAVELDRRCIAALAELAAAYPGRLTVIEGDARRIDLLAQATAPRRVVANLPYNVATPLIVGWIRDIASYESLTLMVQKEVAERIVAAPRTPSYGRLGALVGWRAEARRLFDVDPRAFTPPPRVTSSVVRIVPRAAPLADADFAAFERVTAAAFGQRRKMLRSALATLGQRPAGAAGRGRRATHRARRGTSHRGALRHRPRPLRARTPSGRLSITENGGLRTTKRRTACTLRTLPRMCVVRLRVSAPNQRALREHKGI